jgi:enamine deaminase RidA (YjgF/YER057c/UK114 family)
MSTITRHAPWAGLLHEVVTHNDTLYLSGIVSEDLSLDTTGQAEDCMRQLNAVLAAHGSDLAHVLQAHIYIVDMTQKQKFDTVWKRHFLESKLPARAGVGVSDLGPNVLVEIVVIAARR